MSVPNIRLRRIGPQDAEFVRGECRRHWDSAVIWSRGTRFAADELAGFVALLDDRPVGHVTIFQHGSECEIVTLASVLEDRGIGSELLLAAVEEARARGCERIFLTTSNDNLKALGFYQRHGWRLVTIHRGQIDQYRAAKPEIPAIGLQGIPIHDELELELRLTRA